MKNLTLISLILLVLSCNTNTNQVSGTDQPNSATKQFDWLLGPWKQLNQDKEKVTYEVWKKVAKKYLGHGFILKGQDTVWQERMVLSPIDEQWSLDVNTPGNPQVVKFKLSNYSSTSFTAENPTHDFPQKIKYWKDGDKLSAEVSSGDKRIPFEFERSASF